MSKAKEVALISLLSAACVVGRWACSSLPNISPMTTIVIMVTQKYGLKFGVKLVVVATLVSNLLLGMGIWTVFQILAWVVITVLASKIPYQNVKTTLLFCLAAGFIFGFVVSFEKVVYGGLEFFLPYYLAGLIFDVLHAVGNLIFYPICYPAFKRILQ